MTHDTATAAVGRRELRGVLAVVMLGMLVAALAQTLVATALPTIVGELPLRTTTSDEEDPRVLDVPLDDRFQAVSVVVGE